MAEVIHDVAPEAQLFIARADNPPQVTAATNCMSDHGVRIINYSVLYPYYEGPGDGTGPFVTFVDNIVNKNPSIFWSNAAGNWSDHHWRGAWSDPDNNDWLNFSPNMEYLRFHLDADQTLRVDLRWSEPNLRWDGACFDYDLVPSNAQNHDEQSVAGALFGDPDAAMRFNGSGAHVALPSGFSPLAAGVTLEAWVYPTSNATWARIIELGNGSGGDMGTIDEVAIYNAPLSADRILEHYRIGIGQ